MLIGRLSTTPTLENNHRKCIAPNRDNRQVRRLHTSPAHSTNLRKSYKCPFRRYRQIHRYVQRKF